MAISEKKQTLRKNNCINLTAITASLVFAQLLEGSSSKNYDSPKCTFLEPMICGYPIECAGMNVPSNSLGTNGGKRV